VSYQWYRNGASISGAIDSVFYVTATGDYHVKVTSLSNGCSASTSDVNFSINPSPLVAITYNAPLTFCEGSSVVLNSPYNSNYRYEWSKDGVPYSGNQPNIHASQTGNYSLIITNTHSNCIKRSDTIAVKVLPNPVVTASYTPSTNVLTTSQSYSTYQWFVNSQAIGGATTRNHTPTVNGGYKVQVSDNNGCWGMSDIIFVNELGVASTQLGKSIKIFPNPTSGVLNISATAPVTYKVLDITGKVIVTGDNDKIDMSATTDGAYILLISDKEGQLIRSERITKKSGY
jgi:hypothetical protein